MPIYEYKCIGCGERFELLRSISSSDADISCPNCGDKEIQKVISAFTTVATPSTTTAPSSEACSQSGST